MRAIELGGNVYREVKIAHRLERHGRVGHCNRKISAKTDQRLGAPVTDRLDGFDRVVAAVAWWLKSEDAGQSVEKRVIWNLGNADRAISLHIRVAAQRRNSGALTSDIAAQHQQIGDLLHVARAV